jgi:O-antigen/teichoic acid export membrane protein
LADELRIASILLFFSAVNGAQTGVLSGFEAFRTIARINLARGLVTFPVTVGLVLLWRLPGAIWALAVTAALTCFWSQLRLRQHCAALGIRPRFSGAWRERRVLWTFSIPAFLSGALVGPVTWVANNILVNQPGGYAEMGVLSAASQWRNAVVFLPSLLSQPLLSILSNVGATDRGSFGKLLRANVLLAFAISSAVAAPIILGASWIMSAYGPGFRGGRPVLIVLVLATVISVTAGVIGQAIAGLDRMWWGLALNLVWAVVMLAAAIFLVPRHGALGVALALLGSYVAHALAVAAYARIHLRNRAAGFESGRRPVVVPELQLHE